MKSIAIILLSSIMIVALMCIHLCIELFRLADATRDKMFAIGLSLLWLFIIGCMLVLIVKIIREDEF